MADIGVKICGLTARAHVEACARAGARYVGFVFFAKSPRNVSFSLARDLALQVPPGIAKVGLVVDPKDALLDGLLADVPLDLLQLHGEEPPERVVQIKDQYGLPVMKAVGVADEGDLAVIADYSAAADQLLIDAKPPRSAELPGGNGLSFDWRLIAGRKWAVPWMLAGGLRADNVADAIRLTGARQVDVSSGVECAPGQKDQGLISSFVQAAVTSV